MPPPVSFVVPAAVKTIEDVPASSVKLVGFVKTTPVAVLSVTVDAPSTSDLTLVLEEVMDPAEKLYPAVFRVPEVRVTALVAVSASSRVQLALPPADPKFKELEPKDFPLLLIE